MASPSRAGSPRNMLMMKALTHRAQVLGQHGHRAEEVGEHATPVNVADHDGRHAGPRRQAQVHDVVVEQVDLGRAARAPSQITTSKRDRRSARAPSTMSTRPALARW